MDIYIFFKSQNERTKLLNNIHSRNLKAFISSTIKNGFMSDQLNYKDVIENYKIDAFQKTKGISYLLFLFINIIINSDKSKRIEEILILIKNKLEKEQLPQLNSIIKTGLMYFNNVTERKKFSDALKNAYTPCCIHNFFENKNE